MSPDSPTDAVGKSPARLSGLLEASPKLLVALKDLLNVVCIEDEVACRAWSLKLGGMYSFL